MRSVEIGVDFRAIADDQPVGFGDILVQIGGQAGACDAGVHHFHRRVNGAAHGRLADAQPVQDVDLAFGRAAAVAAHSRHDEGRAAGRFDQRHQFSGDAVDLGDAAAAEAEGDALAFDLRRQVQPREFGLERPVDINRLAFGQGLLDRMKGGDCHIVHDRLISLADSVG